MQIHTMAERKEFYALSRCGKQWPDSIPHEGRDGRLYGMWILGQDYRNKTPYYGAYPPNFLERVMALFPDAKHEEILHLFSGSLPKGTLGLRVDINPKTKPDIVADAHTLHHYYSMSHGLNAPWVIVADPPYSAEDAIHYGTCMIKRNVVMRQCVEVLQPGGYIVWLDQVLPMYRKEDVELVAAIGIVRSTNHRVRAVFIFRKRETAGERSPAQAARRVVVKRTARRTIKVTAQAV